MAAVALLLLGYGAYTGALQDVLDRATDEIDGATGDGPDSSTGGGSGDVDVAEARAQLDALEVAEWGGMDGYSRERFYHWRTVDGCDARQRVLARDGANIETESGDDCDVVSGEWTSAFDGETVTDPSDLDIDHIVPLANAWRTGADEWDDDRRTEFANDMDTPQLIAVSASSNRAKGDQDPSQWQPPDRDYWCQYAHDWIVVKHHWELSVTDEEAASLSDMLDTC